jgi:diaminohydroxyphosphoribosylaminopyrimidine deaminase/5-amino-6-(5-phosphoribosylamino)uracil reductase
MFKKKGITLIKGKLNKDKFDIKLILKKLYVLGCRNLLVEGGNDLSKHIVNKRLFNQFYLYKCAKSLSKLVIHKEFSFLNELKKNYKNKLKITKKLGKDVITLYK